MLPARLKTTFSRFFGYQHLSAEEIEYRTLALTIIVLITLLDFTYNLDNNPTNISSQWAVWASSPYARQCPALAATTASSTAGCAPAALSLAKERDGGSTLGPGIPVGLSPWLLRRWVHTRRRRPPHQNSGNLPRRGSNT